MSAPFVPPRTPEPLSPTAQRRIARAGAITGRLLVALLFFLLGTVLMGVGVELIRSDAEAFATWRTGAGVLVLLITGDTYESCVSVLKRAFRP